MSGRVFMIAFRYGLLAIPIAANTGDDRPLPRPGLWQDSSTVTHYDPAGRPVAIDGAAVRRPSERHCLTAREIGGFYANPLPTCRFDLRREGTDTYRAIAACPASGMRFDVVRHVTPDAIDTRSVQPGRNGARVVSTSRSMRIGECEPTTASDRPDDDAPRPMTPPATWGERSRRRNVPPTSRSNGPWPARWLRTRCCPTSSVSS